MCLTVVLLSCPTLALPECQALAFLQKGGYV